MTSPQTTKIAIAVFGLIASAASIYSILPKDKVLSQKTNNGHLINETKDSKIHIGDVHNPQTPVKRVESIGDTPIKVFKEVKNLPEGTKVYHEENHVGSVEAGAKVKTLERYTSEEGVKFSKIEILEGLLKGRLAWTETDAIKYRDSVE